MTIKEAHEKHLDVFFFNGEGTRTAHAAIMRATGHTVIPFEEVISQTTLLCTAVGPRPKAGETARTVRQFIREQ